MIKHYISILFFCLLGFVGSSQTPSENYIKTIKHKYADNNSMRDVSPNNAAAIDVTYFDGLGRPKQHIAINQAGNGGDMVIHMEYDEFGRQVKEYLPYHRNTHSSMAYESDGLGKTLQFYSSVHTPSTAYPFSQKEFDNSPLSRLLKQAAPGEVWRLGQGNEIKMDYQTNTATEVFYFKVVNPTSTPALQLHIGNNGRYPANQLYKSVTKDENWKPTNGILGTVVEYKDKLGRVVLKRTYSTSSGRDVEPNVTIALDTYYVYDDYGNLTFVLPPKLSESIISGTTLVGNHGELMDHLGYRYKYDHRNRLIHKKLPGKRIELIAYDALNRVIAVGPVPSPFMDGTEDGWLHTKYDVFNRVVYTLWSPVPVIEGNRQAMEAPQTYISEARSPSANTIDGIQLSYTNQVYPTSGKLLAVNYYDDYGYVGAPTVAIGLQIEDQLVYYNNTTKPKGLPTGSWVRILENSSNTNASKTYMLYDVKSRPIRSRTANYLGGYTQVDTKFNFLGNPLLTTTRHKRINSDTETVVTDTFTYNPQERMVSHSHKVGSNPTELLNYNEYDVLGKLKAKKVGGTDISGAAPLQKVDYKYNIRGWLTDINNVANLAQSGAPQDLFAFRINYNIVTNDVNGNVKPLYNGNIAETLWRTSSDNIRRKYGYTYDYQNRLLDAWYQIPGSAVPLMNSYNEHLTYDKNGNILTLQRNGEHEDINIPLVAIDELAYDYDLGNRLLNVTDTTGHTSGFNDANSVEDYPFEDDFEYDTYGNLVKDRNKGITSIVYNHLHLPKTITFGSDGTIEYLYDATGSKLNKKVTNNTSTPIQIKNTHYLDGFQYTDSQMDFFPHTEGYVKVSHSSSGGVGGPQGASYNYVYNYTDHLGNIRLRYTKDTQGPGLAILEEDHYYPFGLKHEGYNGDHKILDVADGLNIIVIIPITPTRTEKYKYKFGGKELQSEFGIEMYDFGARNYDPALGRWMNIDPLADHPKQFGFSPYAYAANNPIFFIDPDGRLFDDYEFNKDSGELKLVKETDDDFDMIYATKENESGDVERTGESVKVDDTNVLDRELGDIDFSERGLVFQIGDLENGLKVMNFLSFKSENGRELSGLGFSEKGSNSSGLFINPWKWNTSSLSIDFASMKGTMANNLFNSETTGNVSFKIHTHPRTRNYTPSGVPGEWGDLNSYNPKYPHYIQSEYGGASQYNNTGYSRQNSNFMKKYF